jgi:UDP-N-acetylglucosamine diphosphorylase/glucosamine-1-phosphate N-acetyltransferase
VSEFLLFDDARARAFEPFALTRPAGELRAGGELVRQRWERALGRPVSGFVGAAHLADFDEAGAPHSVGGTLAPGTILANARCAPALDRVGAGDGVRAWRCNGTVAAVRLAFPVSMEDLDGGNRSLDTLVPPTGATIDLSGWWIDEVWDLIRHLPSMLAADIPRLAATIDGGHRATLERIGDYPVSVDADATIEPWVVFDATTGPILVRRGATVHSFTRLVGPCVIGEDTQIVGGKVTGCSIGNGCRVHGEISTSIVLGHSNKAHDGFVGHSVLGRWVNLGAGSITSNLKNTYGTVALWTPHGLRDTGVQFLGTFFGDHAKTAIGTHLTTGSVIGAGANVFGSSTTPKVVAPFAWGLDDSGTAYDLARFLQVAGRVMSRRDVLLSERAKKQLTAAYAARWKAAP